jgi:hypothetical protein
MDQQQLLDLILANKWWAVAALVVGFAVRMVKSDGPLPITIPPRWRPWLAMILGALAATFEKVNAGISWKQALAGGLLAALLAIGGHQLVIESVRNGQELGGEPKKPDPKPPA